MFSDMDSSVVELISNIEESLGPTSDFPVKLGKHVPKKRLIHISTRYGHSDSVYVLTHRDYSILKTNQMYITAHPINTKAFLQVSHSSVRPLDAVIDCRYAWLDRIEPAFTSHKLPGNSIGISHYCKRMGFLRKRRQTCAINYIHAL